MSNNSKSFKKTKTKSSFLKNLSFGQKISLLLFALLLLILPLVLLASSNKVKLFKKATSPFVSFGQAIKLNPPAGYVEIPASLSMMTATDFTVEAWIKPSSTGIGFTGPSYIIVRENENGKKETYSLQTRGKNIHFQLFKSQGTSPPIDIFITAKTKLEPEKWYHVAGIVDSVSAFLFVNGNLDADIVSIPGGFGGDAEPSTLKTYIGCLPNKIFNRCFTPFYGEIDEVRLSRNPSYYLLNPQIPTQPLFADEFTQGLWHFDGNLADASRNSNNGQALGNYEFVMSTVPVPIFPTSTPTTALLPTITKTPTPKISPAPSCSLLGPAFVQSGGQTITPHKLTSNWNTQALSFTPQKKGKLDKAQLFVSGSGKITAAIASPNGTLLSEEVTVTTSTKGNWITFNFSKEPIVKTNQNYLIKFKAPSGIIYVHSGANWNWGRNIFIKPCLN